MGQCFQPNSSSQKYRCREFRDIIPLDTQLFTPQVCKTKLPKLLFEGHLSNIKIINCPAQYFSIKIKIDEIIQIDLPKRKRKSVTNKSMESFCSDDELKWISREHLSFVMNQFQLRMHFLNVFVYNQHMEVEAHIKVNLFAIVTGPYHHDFFVKLMGHNSRLLFDLNLSEKAQGKLETISVHIELDKNYLGQQFTFSLKQMTHGQVVSSSKSSSSQVVPYEMDHKSAVVKELNSAILQDESPTHRRKVGKGSLVMIDGKSNIDWLPINVSKEDSQNQEQIVLKTKQSQILNKKRHPYLKILILSNEIIKSSVQFTLWTVNRKQSDQNSISDQIQGDKIIFGLTQINLYKIFDQVSSQVQVSHFNQNQGNQEIKNKKFKLQIRNFLRVQNLISNEGLILGKCWLNFRLINPNFFKQMNYCAKTQDGIINMTPVFKNYSGKSPYLRNKTIGQIVLISQCIQRLTNSLSQLSTSNSDQRRSIIRLQNQIYIQFQKMNKQLVNSMNDSFVLSSSNVSQELLDAQLTLIQTLQQIYTFLAEQNSFYTDIGWEVAVNIFKRGQFYLENLGFVRKIKAQDQIVQPKQNIKKIEVGYKFKQQICKFVKLSLLQDVKYDSEKVVWSQVFKAYAYFRIPIFRKQILSILEKYEDQNLIQWKIAEFQQFTPSNKLNDDKISNHLDWKKFFHQPLQTMQQSTKLDQQLQQMLSQSVWIKKLKKRETQFFFFVSYLFKRLGQIGRSINIMKWKYFPGYTKIIRSFLIQMKSIQIKKYSSLMINSSVDLLANPQLINVLMPLIMQKTNIFNNHIVKKSMSLLWNYFVMVTDDGKKRFPQMFNYVYFFRMVKLICENQNSFTISKVMSLVYKFFRCFNQQFKGNLSMYLMGKVFFRLFFHWSFTVRTIFHIVFISRIYFQLVNQPNMIVSRQTFFAHNQLNERFKTIQRVIFNAQIIKKQEQNQCLYKFCFQDLHKKMKKKLIHKLKNEKVQTSSQKIEISKNIQSKGKFLIGNLMKPNLISMQKSLFIFNPTKTQTTLQKVSQQNVQKSQQAGQTIRVLKGSSYRQQQGIIQKSMRLFDKQVDSSDSEHSIDGYIKNEKKTSTSYNFRKASQCITSQTMLQDLIQGESTENITRRKVIQTYFGNQDSQLKQLDQLQIRSILVSMKDYKTTLAEINKIIQDKNKIPEFNLEVQLDKDGEFQPDILKWTRS